MGTAFEKKSKNNQNHASLNIGGFPKMKKMSLITGLVLVGFAYNFEALRGYNLGEQTSSQDLRDDTYKTNNDDTYYNKRMAEGVLWDWPEGTLMQWEKPGNCALRPTNVSKDCCFGGGRHNYCAFRSADLAHHLEQEIRSRLQSLEDVAPRDQEGIEGSSSSSSSTCPICDVAEHLIRYNLTLTLEGDSVMEQNFLGLTCAFQRRGYRISEVEHYRPRRTSALMWKYGTKHVYVFRFLMSMDSSVYSGQIVYFKAFRALDADEHFYVWNNTDILIFDHGLHWDVSILTTEYLPAMVDYLTVQQRPPHLKLLAWRETTVQHFPDKAGGYWEPGNQSEAGDKWTYCTPWANGTGSHPQDGLVMEAATRNFSNTTAISITDPSVPGIYLYEMEKACQLANITLLNSLDKDFRNVPLPSGPGGYPDNSKTMNELIYFPSRYFQANLFALHEGINGDCTHYCNTAMFWDPTWRGLSQAMDRTFRQYSHEPEAAASMIRAAGFPEFAALRREKATWFDVPKK